MGEFLNRIISEWGVLGLVLIGVCYLIYLITENKNRPAEKRISNKTISNKIDDVITKLDSSIDRAISIEALNNKLYELLELIIYERHDHSKMFEDRIKLGEDIHSQLKEYNLRIGSDHIFVGSFHNGNSSITGIPYYKFDIIAERFKYDMNDQDLEFAPLYKDSDLSRFDKLPALLMQTGVIYFKVPPTGYTDLSEYDDIIWRRMRSRGIQQIALRLLRDSSGTASGFVGVIKFDDNPLDIKELDMCGSKMEGIYHKNEKKLSKIYVNQE